MTCRGDLQGAFDAGSKIEGGAAEVIAVWLEEVRDALQVEKAMKELMLHVKRNEFLIVCVNSISTIDTSHTIIHRNKHIKQHLSYSHHITLLQYPPVSHIYYSD